MECRILMPSLDADSLLWCKRDEKTGEVVEQGNARADQLKTLYSGSQKLVFFVPQQDVLMTSHQYPARANKQQINAIAYSIEEDLAQDPDHCFISAANQQPDHSLPVAVIERDKMDLYAQSLSQFQLHAHAILPASYLCPWPDEDILASICEIDEGFLIRYGTHQGVFANRNTLSTMLNLLIRNNGKEHKRILIHADSVLDLRLPDEIELVQQPSINLLGQGLDYRSCINLKQKEYDSSYQLFSMLRHWRVPFALAVVLIAVTLGNVFLDINNKQAELNELHQQQRNLLLRHLPDADGANPKAELIRFLSQTRQATRSTEFVDLFHQFSRLIAGFSAIKITRVQYQQNRLIANLESGDLKTMEDFRARLSQSTIPARIEDVNISPDKTIGRLIMEPGS